MSALITQEHKLMAEPAAQTFAGSIRSSSRMERAAERAATAPPTKELSRTESNVFLLHATRGSKSSLMDNARIALITRGNRTMAAADWYADLTNAEWDSTW